MPFPTKGFPSKGPQGVPGKKPFPPSPSGKAGGPPSPADDLDAPDPLDKMDAPPVSPKKPTLGADPGGDPAEESAETPGYESTEEQGAKLISDIEAAGEQFGLDPDTSRGFAASVFTAMAKCLGGGSGDDESAEGDGAAGPPAMPIDRYGR